MNKITINPISYEKNENCFTPWIQEDYVNLLDLFDQTAEGMKPDEIKDFCMMTIADTEVHESAKIVLKYLIGDGLTDGQYENLSQQMEDDKMWEEFPEISLHKYIFKANQLLYKSYNGKVPHGFAKTIKLEVEVKDEKLSHYILENEPDILLRMVIAGTDEHSLLNRLFDTDKEYLEDAKDVIWYAKTKKNGAIIEIELLSSTYWFEDYIADIEYEIEVDIENYENEVDND
jgi:hypothetical protein